MDFYQIVESEPTKQNVVEIYPDFIVRRSKDLMVRGRSFYAIWDRENGIWSTDEYDVQRLIDHDLEEYYKKRRSEDHNTIFKLQKLRNSGSRLWTRWLKYVNELPENFYQLDETVKFANDPIKKTDYVSRRLPYPLEAGSIDAYEELISTLYDPDERAKLEWAIGSIIAGDAKTIQKFVVLYGEMGSGKSTFLNIVQKLFEGYYTTFEAKALTSSGHAFSMEVFRDNPLVAIQHDGDLSRIEDNTRLNSIVSHEVMTMNEKYMKGYSIRINSFLFMGTNKPVKITDAKSGIIRRLIDVRPSLRKVPTRRYHHLISQIDFELGAIAHHCLEVYRNMGKNYYSSYRPTEMMLQTDVFFNFIEECYFDFKKEDGVTLSRAYDMYKAYCNDALVEYKLARHKFREELKSYFRSFDEVTRIENKQVRSYYSGFIFDKFSQEGKKEEEESPCTLVLDHTKSILDDIYKDCPAQYAKEDGTPEKRWDEVKTVLEDIDTSRLHYVRLPKNHIVIDFDLKNDKGVKSFEKNIEAASRLPRTYAECSRSGNGLHLHYIYTSDTSLLSGVLQDGVEIKTFVGKSALRRQVTKCNSLSIATINTGLPLKGEKPMLNFDSVRTEQWLREMITRNLHKEFHPGTKPSIDFIWKILDDAYKSEMVYDITDMRQRVLSFAMGSTNQSDYCIKLVAKMKFASEEKSPAIDAYEDDTIIFYDVEVFPNLFVVVWKKQNDPTFIKMINPTADEIEQLLKFKLVGFNCRRYDNHILYARYIGYDNMQLYNLSQKIVNNNRNCMFGEAYNISYADVYDFSSKKQSLKKFQIELGLHHQELGLPWDQPVPEERWSEVADYCCNDVDTTEATFNARYQDFIGRQILADLSGLAVNDTTQMHTAKIIFGNDNKPQDKFIYTDLNEMFPGYIFDRGISTYREEEVGEGGYVYAEPGMYSDVAILDVASMHPTSIRMLDLFGPYTKNFTDLVDARLAIKHADYDSARQMFNYALEKHLESKEDAEALSYALKIIINSVYGFTSAKFENKFKDPRNKDNIVAKRGALFMIDLKHAVQEKGFKVIHIKTDSIKIPNATKEIIEFVYEFGKKYGYTFEHEMTFDRICLLNDAVYVGKVGWSENQKKYPPGSWTSTGTQLIHPYVFKTLFTPEVPIEFSDLCETKTVQTALYLDMNERNEENHDYHFVGKAGSFCPIKPGCGGGILLREKEGKYYAANGSKGYRWLESEMVQKLGKEGDIDYGYYDALVESAIKNISEFGSWESFISG